MDERGGQYLFGYYRGQRIPIGGHHRYDNINLADEDYGRNWSREEEEVSQILRNLRGI